MENALSIDLEDWYHPYLVQPHLQGNPMTPRVVEATEPLLALLKQHGVRATFFCVGEVVAQHPGLVRRIHHLGHEIAFHGMDHRPLWDLNPDEFEAELVEFDLLAHRVLGQDVSIRGYRAPTFSLDHRTSWALPILARRGYRYDSSVFPRRGPLYGVPRAPVAPYRIADDDPAVVEPKSVLTEIPPAVCELLGVRLPVAGGVYLRLLPLGLVVNLLKRINTERPFVIYVHPWETDPGTPRVLMPTLARFATYGGIRHTLAKLERLLSMFRFTTVDDTLERWNKRPEAGSQEAKC